MPINVHVLRQNLKSPMSWEISSSRKQDSDCSLLYIHLITISRLYEIFRDLLLHLFLQAIPIECHKHLDRLRMQGRYCLMHKLWAILDILTRAIEIHFIAQCLHDAECTDKYTIWTCCNSQALRRDYDSQCSTGNEALASDGMKHVWILVSTRTLDATKTLLCLFSCLNCFRNSKNVALTQILILFDFNVFDVTVIML